MRFRWLVPLMLVAAAPAAAQDVPADAPAGASTDAPIDDAPTDEAIAAIALPEQQLRGLLARVIFGTQTTLMAAEAMGIQAFCATTVPAVDAAVEKHLPAWRTNLVAAYRGNIPAADLATAVGQEAAVAAATVRPHLETVGVAMQKASSPLLKDAATSVLDAVGREAAKHDIKSVDMEKRRAELKAGAADGSTFCGLLGRPQPK